MTTQTRGPSKGEPVDPFDFIVGMHRNRSNFPDVDDITWAATCRKAWDEMSPESRKLNDEMAAIFRLR